MIDKRYYEKLGGFAYLLGELRKKLGREQTDVLVNDAVTLCKGTDFELPFLLAVWLGLRTSEIRGLTWDCLDGDILTIKQAMVDGEDGPQLKQPKTYSGNRKLKVPPYIMGCLTKHRTQMSILSMQPEMSCISICKSRVLTEDNLQISQVMRKQVSQKALANTRKTPQPLRLRGFLLSGGFNSDILPWNPCTATACKFPAKNTRNFFEVLLTLFEPPAEFNADITRPAFGTHPAAILASVLLLSGDR